jgi:hypothetical protein
MLQISVPLVSSRWTSVNKCGDTVSLLRLRKNYHYDWKSQLFFVCIARDKMDDSISLRIPRLSATQKAVSFSLVAQCQWPCNLRRGYAAAHLAGIVGLIPTQGHGCLSLVSVVCCQVQVSTMGWSLIQKSPINCDALIMGSGIKKSSGTFASCKNEIMDDQYCEFHHKWSSILNLTLITKWIRIQ